MIPYGYIPEDDKGPKRLLKRIIRRSLRWLLLPLFNERGKYFEYGNILKKYSNLKELKDVNTNRNNRNIYADNQLQASLIKAKEGTQIEPYFEESDTAIFFAASDTYTSILGTLINSIVINASDSDVYDLIVFETDMSVKHMNMLSGIGRIRDNISIRFVDVNDLIDSEQLERCSAGFTYYTFLRLLAPELLSKYEKALYLDSDTVVNTDISELYNTNMEGYLVAGAIDIAFPAFSFKDNISYYNSIGLYDCNTYINSGVLLFNISEFRRAFPNDFFFDKAMEYTYKWPDQDLMNVFCKGKILCIDIAWNVFSINESEAEKLEIGLPDDLYYEYTTARKNPKIIHFVNHKTLNRVPVGDFSEVYWKYAKNSPFYENLIFE